MSSSTESKGLNVVATATTFCVLAFGFVVTRLIARVRILKNAGYDELAIVLSVLFSIGFTVLIFMQVKSGLGKHVATLSGQDIENLLIYLWWSIHLYNISLALTKLSIVLQYLRVFVGNRVRLACWIMIGIITVCGLFALLSGVFTCVPIAKFWNPSINGRCIPKRFLWFFNAALNIMTDCLILTLPMPVIQTLKLPKNQKIGLTVIFALGGFVCIVSIIRLYSLYVVSESSDVTFDNANTSMWSAIECNVGIICASLPTIKPVISWLFPRLLPSSRGTGPTAPSYNIQNTFHSSRNEYRQTHIPLYDMGSSPEIATKVEASKKGNVDRREKEGEEQSGKEDRSSKQIVVTSTVMQDIENKSDTGSEKDLISQK